MDLEKRPNIRNITIIIIIVIITITITIIITMAINAIFSNIRTRINPVTTVSKRSEHKRKRIISIASLTNSLPK